MHFYEASIITTKDGLYCQVYGNEHPTNAIIVKPKYIPTDQIECEGLQFRFIHGRRMNRLNLWADKEKLREYIEKFRRAYPEYLLKSNIYDEETLLFAIPIGKIERIYSPKRGLSELMDIEKKYLDKHLLLVRELVDFILESGLTLEDLGITYSSLVGHYSSEVSDINLVVHGKKNFWKLMGFLDNAEHEKLRWKTNKEWLDFREKRNRKNLFGEEEFVKTNSRKKSEGFFGDTLFVIFCAEKSDETWFKWGKEKYSRKGFVKIKAKVKDNYNSIVRPGYYEIEDSEILEGYENVPVERVVFYSRDYAMSLFCGEGIEARGILEEVTTKNGTSYYRVVVGYLDSYISERREQEYIKSVSPNKIVYEEGCNFCKETLLSLGEVGDYGARIIYKTEGNVENSWIATLSPKTGGDPEKDFCVQLIPNNHLRYFSDINSNEELAKNYGLAFAKICWAVGRIISEEGNDSNRIPLGVYGKCKHENEHIHIKVFPWRGDIGQPYTLDSSFGKKEVYNDGSEEYIKMSPVKKNRLSKERFDYLSRRLGELLNEVC